MGHLATHSVDHFDILFNMWRLEWVRHALLTSPGDLFNGNQFYPERGVFAYSDAMMVQSLIALPLLSAGLPVILVHNLLLLGAMAASGIGMFVLARYLWGNPSAAIVAGIIFAFAPYRFSHFMHLELQWAMWMPWAFWAMQRTLDTGALRYGLLTGLFMALQLTSSIYYGLFLAIILAAVSAIQASVMGRRAVRAVAALAAGALILAVTAWVYSGPYRQTSAKVGLRDTGEIRRFSADKTSYLRVPETNWLLGGRRAGGTEVSLYPGVVPVALGLISLAAMRPSRITLAYAAGLALAVDFSFGLNGLLYPHLQYHAWILKSLRAPSRASILFLLCLAVLAARATAGILARVPASKRALCVGAIVAAIMVEYWSGPMRLIPYPRRAQLYEFLAQLPDGIVLELPAPRLKGLPYPPFRDARYLYASTFHWKTSVNGYSGYYPSTYFDRLVKLDPFPSPEAIEQIREDKVRYIVVHEGQYLDPNDGARVVEALVELGASPLANMHDGWAFATLLDVQPITGAPILR
jgi:hypothetical protein